MDLKLQIKDIEKLGRNLMKEVYKYFNDGKNIFILVNKNNIEEIKKEKDEIKKNLVKFYFDDIIKYYFEIILNTNDDYKDKIDNDKDKIEKFFCLYFNNHGEKDKLKIIKDKIENKSLDIDFIYQILNKINKEIIKKYVLLYLRMKGFLNIYSTYKLDHKYLKD